MRRFLLLAALALLPAWTSAAGGERLPSVAVADLPAEARHTLALVKQGGPFPYPRDGVVFGNFEHRLPAQPRGYYHEYTVPTPGSKGRGARRIVAGAGIVRDVRGAGETYYSDDHYRSFRRILE
jgi:ribonuclease T1